MKSEREVTTMRTKKIVYRTTAEGRKLLDAAERFAGYELSDVYERCSAAKIKAFKEVYGEYCADTLASEFWITTANNFTFCVSWCSIAENGEQYTRYITAKYDYWIF